MEIKPTENLSHLLIPATNVTLVGWLSLERGRCWAWQAYLTVNPLIPPILYCVVEYFIFLDHQ